MERTWFETTVYSEERIYVPVLQVLECLLNDDYVYKDISVVL